MNNVYGVIHILKERIPMLDFNLYYAQAAAASRNQAPRTVATRTTRSTKRIFRLGTRRGDREGSAG